MIGIFPNGSCVTEFLILGFSHSPNQKVPLFLIFLLIYLFTVLSNLVIIVLICLDRKLHKPMYFFLCNMSVLDISYTSVTSPNFLHIILSENKRISFRACMAQLFLFNSLGSVEYMLLTSMAYDRYQAICNPLHYCQTMNRKRSLILSTVSWVGGFIAALPISIFISALSYCSSNTINHIFCDMSPLLTLACDDTSSTELLVFVEGVFICLNCFILTAISYTFIISDIIKICSFKGRVKAFSTCVSHLTVVILFYASITCMYMKPTSSSSLNEEKALSVLYINIVPMLNPIIYTLRNKEVKEAAQKLYQVLSTEIFKNKVK
ncbi:hypothetical protein GDO86_018007 [Hymenochirus boettgeri]|uniref:Olfactory receptor n=1 Tax=Hymenochirus boettgeri TaxID=247094 RepID=A0A8T2IGX0_9PIPI|nr:hypothetical protein GDO86_018007 [Hymenochirus boettgeri]